MFNYIMIHFKQNVRMIVKQHNNGNYLVTLENKKTKQKEELSRSINKEELLQLSKHLLTDLKQTTYETIKTMIKIKIKEIKINPQPQSSFKNNEITEEFKNKFAAISTQ